MENIPELVTLNIIGCSLPNTKFIIIINIFFNAGLGGQGRFLLFPSISVITFKGEAL